MKLLTYSFFFLSFIGSVVSKRRHPIMNDEEFSDHHVGLTNQKKQVTGDDKVHHVLVKFCTS